MKLLNKVLPYKLKRALPVVGLATATLGIGATMTSCEKEPMPEKHDVVLEFGFMPRLQVVSLKMDTIVKYVNDPAVETIYMKLLDGDDATFYSTPGITATRDYLAERIDVAPQKVKGQGNFEFAAGMATPEDSLWFVQHGWTVNQKQH